MADVAYGPGLSPAGGWKHDMVERCEKCGGPPPGEYLTCSLDECPYAPKPEILDACCGGRMWWWDKAHPLAVYMDKRAAPAGSSFRPNWKCAPDVIGDFRAMPFGDESFQLVVFDPPHLTRDDPAAVLRAETGLRYGVLQRDTADDDLRRGFSECWRVLAAGGTLIFKWGGKVDRVRQHFPATPIVGTRSLRKGSGLGTRWFVFYKPLAAATEEVAA